MFSIPYSKTGYFSNLMIGCLNPNRKLRPLYDRFPVIENFKEQIQEKHPHCSAQHRAVLAQSLEQQYQNFTISDKTRENIKSLSETNTFTIVMGHQLNLFTGPLYFRYKIITTINLCKELKTTYPEQNFMPVYWMATEDHDFEEINFFNFNRVKFQWNTKASGPVGRLNTDSLQTIYEKFKQY